MVLVPPIWVMLAVLQTIFIRQQILMVRQKEMELLPLAVLMRMVAEKPQMVVVVEIIIMPGVAAVATQALVEKAVTNGQIVRQ